MFGFDFLKPVYVKTAEPIGPKFVDDPAQLSTMYHIKKMDFEK